MKFSFHLPAWTAHKSFCGKSRARLALAVFVMAIACEGSAVAGAQPLQYAVLGYGAKTCGALTKAILDLSADDLKPETTSEERDSKAFMESIHMMDVEIYKSWAQGYITAYNQFYSPSGDVTQNLGEIGILSWLNNYCANHPIDTFSNAVTILIVERKLHR